MSRLALMGSCAVPPLYWIPPVGVAAWRSDHGITLCGTMPQGTTITVPGVGEIIWRNWPSALIRIPPLPTGEIP